jgi:HD superfamily phosphohydrolase
LLAGFVSECFKNGELMADDSQDRFQERGKVVRDSVHGLIAIRPDERYLLDLINAPEFQRLRRIRQLGVSNMTYPGAEHTRFSHSLGVLNFSGRMLDHLKRRYADHSEIAGLVSKYERTIKTAALLHDTGHGPFSHMLERAFPSTASHEARTAQIITGKESEVRAILQHHKIEPDEVRAVIDGTFSVRFLRDIVSSQLDADRMDYLLRDSLMTGVEYGSFDAEWIIHALCLGTDPVQQAPAGANHLRLCLDRARGLQAAEQLIVARMHMSYQVYYHRATRGWEAHLLCLFHLAGILAEAGQLPVTTPEVVHRFLTSKGELTHADFLEFDETVMMAAFRSWSKWTPGSEDQAALVNLSTCFLGRRKAFSSVPLPAADPVEGSFRKQRELEKKGLRERVDFYHDEAKFRGYKDFGSSVVHEGSDDDPQVTGSDGIFLGDGDPAHRAVPLETDPQAVITPALAQRKAFPLNRIYVRDSLS